MMGEVEVVEEVESMMVDGKGWERMKSDRYENDRR
jgi:hypothetical protein